MPYPFVRPELTMNVSCETQWARTLAFPSLFPALWAKDVLMSDQDFRAHADVQFVIKERPSVHNRSPDLVASSRLPAYCLIAPVGTDLLDKPKIGPGIKYL
jgi:hypothetical protein